MNCPYFNNFHNLQNYLFTPLGKNENKREKYDYTIQIILLTHMGQTFYDNIAAEVINCRPKIRWLKMYLHFIFSAYHPNYCTYSIKQIIMINNAISVLIIEYWYIMFISSQTVNKWFYYTEKEKGSILKSDVK